MRRRRKREAREFEEQDLATLDVAKLRVLLPETAPFPIERHVFPRLRAMSAARQQRRPQEDREVDVAREELRRLRGGGPRLPAR